MSRTCLYTTDLHACIHSDRRQDGRTIGRTNERRENIQIDKVTNAIRQKYARTDTRTDGRTDTYTDNIRTGRQTDGHKHTQNCITTFENIPLEERKCLFCNVIESESHALLDCILYIDLRSELFAKTQAVNEEFIFLSAEHKLIFLFSNHNMIRHCAKTCFNLLQRRAFYLCK